MKQFLFIVCLAVLVTACGDQGTIQCKGPRWYPCPTVDPDPQRITCGSGYSCDFSDGTCKEDLSIQCRDEETGEKCPDVSEYGGCNIFTGECEPFHQDCLKCKGDTRNDGDGTEWCYLDGQCFTQAVYLCPAGYLCEIEPWECVIQNVAVQICKDDPAQCARFL